VLSINASQSILKDHALAALQYAFLQNRKVGVSSIQETQVPSDIEIDTASASYEIARELVEWSEKFVVLDDGSTENMTEEKDEHKSNDEDRKNFKEFKKEFKKEFENDIKIQKQVDCPDVKCRKPMRCDDAKHQNQWNDYGFPNIGDDNNKKITIGILCNNFPISEKKFPFPLSEKKFPNSTPVCPSFDFFADETENTGPLYSDDLLLEVPPIPSIFSECDDLDSSPLSSPFSDAGSNLSD